MGKISAKNKIFILLAAWVFISGLMFIYLFGILQNSNKQALLSMAVQKKDLAVLNAEKESFIQAKADLELLAKKDVQPEDFFSKDITLVNELKTLENWEQKLNIKLQISGVSGTINSAAKAPTLTSIAIIPYNLALTGTFTQAINFVEVLENLDFITNITSLTMGAVDQDTVSLGLGANFYLKK